MARAAAALPEALFGVLRGGAPALLLTLGRDGFPASAHTWAVAVANSALRFGADHGSSSLANLEREPRAALQVIAEAGPFLIKGRASPLKPRLESAGRLAIALWELAVVEVKDQRWPGVSVRPLAYEWAAEQREAMLALERAVLEEMRAWQS